MINKRDSYKILSEDTFSLGKDILKIPGNTKHYLEFYRVVLGVSQCLVYRGSTSKRTSTQRYCSTFSPLVGGGMEVDILPPSLPSRWIKSPGGSQIKSIKSFSRIYLEKKPLEISFGWRQADFSKYYNNRMYWHPCSREPLYARHREPLQYKIRTNRQTNNY